MLAKIVDTDELTGYLCSWVRVRASSLHEHGSGTLNTLIKTDHYASSAARHVPSRVHFGSKTIHVIPHLFAYLAFPSSRPPSPSRSFHPPQQKINTSHPSTTETHETPLDRERVSAKHRPVPGYQPLTGREVDCSERERGQLNKRHLLLCSSTAFPSVNLPPRL